MKLAGKRGYGSVRLGVLDAGILLTRLDRSRRGHAAAARLLAPERTSGFELVMSAVNLAEALQHAQPLTGASGVDVVAVLQVLGVRIHSPDVAVARRVAELAKVKGDLSLADRFALATALELRARLFTTDGVLAAAAGRAKAAVTVI